MRTLLAVTLAAPLMMLVASDIAQAQNYPFCAQYSTRGGARNCGFSTWEQCMATVSGIGGYCEQNAMYVPGQGQRVRRKVRRAY